MFLKTKPYSAQVLLNFFPVALLYFGGMLLELAVVQCFTCALNFVQFALVCSSFTVSHVTSGSCCDEYPFCSYQFSLPVRTGNII